jgi:AcrR family transcriptional regulator
VAEVARASNVSDGTVYNYFPAKEDLFYEGMVAFELELIEAVRARPPGTSVLNAFSKFVLDGAARLASLEVAETIAASARIVTGSNALQARERELVAQYTAALAELLAAETGVRPDAVEPWAVANALMGVQRGLVRFVWSAVLAGRKGQRLVTDVRAQGKRAFARLELGLADYAVKER